MAELFLGGLVDAVKHERTGEEVRLETEDFTTHGVIVGMTGSGKTGLGIGLIEEVLRAGLPALLIDPKGDLTNLCLTFPALAPADFRPWIDEAQAKSAGMSPDDFAAQQATMWKDGLAGWGLGGEQIGALRATTDFTIYTPGSQSGVPINIVGSLQVPATDDPEVVGDEIDGFVSGLLGLVGIEADPLSSREHILLANLVQHAWSSGTSLDLAALVGMVQQPPIRKLGVFELEQFFPTDDRTKLAMKLNGLLASPAFAAWGSGQPLDIQTLLYTPDGKGRCAIVTTAHLSDEERQFVTSLVLAKLVTWMRRQSGTTDLRALLYMDEVAGYLPPSANPPTKQPIMLLMKQARAFGVGVVLSTQNPVDVDYKAISNAGTWMVGRLQTDRDKARLLDGMSAAAGGVDIGAIGDTISGLAKREFVLRRAGKDVPEVFTTRWAMSYLRGPMTRDQIEQLMAEHRRRDASTGGGSRRRRQLRHRPPAAAPVGRARRTDPDATPVMPEVGGGVAVRWVDPAAPWLAEIGGDATSATHAPAIVARVSLRYDDTKADLVHDQEYEAVLFPLGSHVDVTTAVAVDYDDRDLRDAAPPSCAYRLTDAPDRRGVVLEAGAARPRRPPHAQHGAGDPDQPGPEAVRAGGRDRRGVHGTLRAGRRRARRRRGRQAPRQVRGQGDEAAQPDRRGDRRRPGRRRPATGAPARRPAVVGRVDPRRSVRRPALPRQPARPDRPRRSGGAARRRRPGHASTRRRTRSSG